MKFALVILVAAAVAVILVAAQAETKYSKAEIAQGDYPVNCVSMCVDYHTPRTREGKLDEKPRLAGSSMG